MLVALAGGAGTAGVRLARRLLAEGTPVRSLDVAPLGDAELAREVSELRGELADPAACRRLVRRADAVVHLALGAPEEATANLLGAAAEGHVRRVVALSSTVRPHVEGERVCAAFARRGLDVVVLRAAPVVDPDRPGALGLLLDRIRAGKAVPLPGGGANRVQLLAAADLDDAILAALDAPGVQAGDVLDVGAVEFGTVREELEALAEHAGTGATVRPLPGGLAELPLRGLERSGLLAGREWQLRAALRDSHVPVDRAEAALGWRPRHSNAAALRQAYDARAAAVATGSRGRDDDAAARSEAEDDPHWEELALRLLRRLR